MSSANDTLANAFKNLPHLTGSEDYSVWKAKLSLILDIKGLLGYVDGTIKEPTSTIVDVTDPDGAVTGTKLVPADATLLDTWNLQNKRAKLDIMFSVSKPLVPIVNACTTAREAWRKFEISYENRGAPQITSLIRKLFTTRYVEGMDIQEHFNNLITMNNEMATLNFVLTDFMFSCTIQASMPESFGAFVSMMSVQPRTVDETCSLLRQEVERRKESNHINTLATETALAAQRTSRPRCANCGMATHSKEMCWGVGGGKQGQGPPERPYGNIKTLEHPNGKPRACVAQTQAIQPVSTLTPVPTAPAPIPSANIVDTRIDPRALVVAFSADILDGYIIDSGATRHISNNLADFVELHSTNIAIRGLGGHIEHSSGVGTVRIKWLDTGRVIELTNVLYTPTSGVRLISKSELDLLGWESRSKNGIYKWFDARGHFLGTAHKQNGMWPINATIEGPQAAANIASAPGGPKANLYLWHCRTGHQTISTIESMIRNGTVEGLDVDIKDPIPICGPCIKGKHERTSFPTSEHRAKVPLERIHADLCGPFSVASKGGHKYFLGLTDDHTRMYWVFFLRDKTGILQIFKDFKAIAENQSNHTWKRLRSDNGGEFVNSELEQWLTSQGIIHETTAPYSPEQNGVAERANRTIMERVRAMLYARNVSLSFWAEAVNTATYLRNRSPTTTLPKGKTPHEMWHGVKPNVGHLRVFGVRCWVHIPDELRRKLDPKSIECIFLGYYDASKAYRCYDPKAQRYYKSCHVIFDETLHKVVETPFSSPAGGVKLLESDMKDSSDKVIPNINEDDDIDHNEHDVQVPIQIELQQDDQQVELGEENRGRENTEAENRSDERANADEENQTEEARPRSRAPRRRIDYGPPSRKSRRKEGLEAEHFVPLDGAPVPETAETRGDDSDNESELSEVPSGAGYTDNDEEYALNVQKAKVLPSGMEPKSYEEAINSEDKEHWIAAMQTEIDTLHQYGTWIVGPRRPGVQLVGSKWVYHIKHDEKGKILKYKARLVAQGFSQRFGESYFDVFAPVGRFESLRMVISLGKKLGWVIRQGDVKSAYLNGSLEELIDLKQPEGFSEGNPGDVCILRAPLYGLKQAGRAWYLHINQIYKELGFVRIHVDHAVYVRKTDTGASIVNMAVDDLVMTSSSDSEADKLEKELGDKVQMIFGGKLHWILGIEVVNQPDGSCILTQRAYIDTLLRRFNLDGFEVKPVATPLDPSVVIDASMSPAPDDIETISEMRRVPYREALGAINYAVHATRPDIAHAAQKLARYSSNPGPAHWTAVKRILKYLKGTRNFGIRLGGTDTDTPLAIYSDADWGEDRDTRKSTSGYAAYCFGSLVSWSSKLQPTVALSTLESEYMAASHAVQQALWMQEFLKELDLPGLELPSLGPTPLYLDNQGTIAFAKGTTSYGRTKHIDIRHHFVREQLEAKHISIDYIPSKENVADLFTKAIARPLFETHLNNLRIHELEGEC